jgi:hypothetical protein
MQTSFCWDATDRLEVLIEHLIPASGKFRMRASPAFLGGTDAGVGLLANRGSMPSVWAKQPTCAEHLHTDTSGSALGIAAPNVAGAGPSLFLSESRWLAENFYGTASRSGRAFCPSHEPATRCLGHDRVGVGWRGWGQAMWGSCHTGLCFYLALPPASPRRPSRSYASGPGRR